MVKKIALTCLLTFSLIASTEAITHKPFTVKDTIKDADIKIPEEIERNLDELLVDWRTSYHKSPSCTQIEDGGSIIYPDSVYIERLYALPTQMELVYNPIVRSYIDMYTGRRKSSVEFMIARSKYYFPFIEETLDKYGLPLELKFLPIIESALNPIAISRAGATGLWQFMLRTGQMYDLEVNSLVDERKDPRKATEAAAKYLQDMYKIYGDWNLVIAAYNCGPGNVNKAIRRSGGQTDYWSIYPYLPKETRGYVPAFIAATYVMNYYDKHNICPMEPSYPTSVDTLFVDKNVHLQHIANVLEMPLKQIQSLNPQYKQDIIPGNFKSYPLCLPSKSIAAFITQQDEIYTGDLLTHRKTVVVAESLAEKSNKNAKTHRVKRGETLGSIAKKYGVSSAHLKKMNGLKSTKISKGKLLVINRGTPVKTAKSPVSTTVLAENNTPKKDTIQTTIDNKLKSGESSLQANQTSQKNTPKTKEKNKTMYRVQKGDSLLIIAKRFKNVTAKDIMLANNLKDSKISIGQKLNIPLN